MRVGYPARSRSVPDQWFPTAGVMQGRRYTRTELRCIMGVDIWSSETRRAGTETMVCTIGFVYLLTVLDRTQWR